MSPFLLPRFISEGRSRLDSQTTSRHLVKGETPAAPAGRGLECGAILNALVRPCKRRKQSLLARRSTRAELDLRNAQLLLLSGSILATLLLVLANWMTGRAAMFRGARHKTG